jgi:hypothetical protein
MLLSERLVMPITFQCQKCQKWLEVDEPHAGGKAICPYCQAINDVPKSPITARPVVSEPEGPASQEKTPFTDAPAEQTRPTSPDVPASKPLEQQGRTERTYRPREEGWFDAQRAGLPPAPAKGRWLTWLGYTGPSLLIIAFGLIVWAGTSLYSLLPASTRNQISTATRPVSGEEYEKLQQQMLQIAQNHGWISAGLSAAFVLYIVGFGVSLVSAFTPGSHRKGAAWAGVVIGGLLFFCLCLNIMRPFVGS